MFPPWSQMALASVTLNIAVHIDKPWGDHVHLMSLAWSPSKFWLLSPDTFSGLFTRLVWEINIKDLRNILSGIPDCLHLSLWCNMKLPSLFDLVTIGMTHMSSYLCATDTLRDLRGSDRAGDQTGGSPEHSPGSHRTAGAANNQSANHHTVHHHNNHQRQRHQWSSHHQTLIMYRGELHTLTDWTCM